MILNKFLENLLKSLKAQRKIITTRVTGEGITTFEDYKFCVGRIKALRESEEMAKKLYSEMIEEGPISKKYEEVVNEKKFY